MRVTERAAEQLLCAIGDPLGALRAVGDDHPEFARAQTLRADAAVLAKVPATLPVIAQSLVALDGVRLPERERGHLQAAAAWLRGAAGEAGERYAAIARRWPQDLMALRLAQSCWFFVGEHERSLRVADQVLQAWNRDDARFRFVLGMAAFAHAEAGDAERADSLGRAALARNPACPMAVHAVAHALVESGRAHRGARWMRAQRAQWAVESRLRTHNAWHLAMFDVDDGRIDSALAILDGTLLPAADRWPLDACDAAVLLWRIGRAGVDVASRWERLSAAFERRWQPGFWAYVDLHAAFAHAAAGQRTRALQLAAAVERRARLADFAGQRARRITLPVLRALEEWAAGALDPAAAQFAALRPLLPGAGGSRLQLGIFMDLADGDGATAQLHSASPGPASASTPVRSAHKPMPAQGWGSAADYRRMRPPS